MQIAFRSLTARGALGAVSSNLNVMSSQSSHTTGQKYIVKTTKTKATDMLHSSHYSEYKTTPVLTLLG